VLEVSTSGYYAWRKREPSAHAKRDQELTEQIKQSHEQSKGTYGRPRVHADLKEAGERVGQKRVARLMREQGLQGVTRRRRFTTTQRDQDARPAPDLVDREFEVEGPNRLWVADITYIPMLAGFLYLAVVLDAWSRRVVGWGMASCLKTQLVLDALQMALDRRRPGSVIHHSDHGSQYTSFEFGRRCREAGVRPSMGSVGDCFDNALCESFFATLECELLERRGLLSPEDTRRAVFEFIEGWYNLRRRHSSLGMLSPAEFERRQKAA
jgi:putative transposase